MFLPIITFLIYSTAVVVNRSILQTFPLFLFVGLRMLLGGLILFSIASIKNRNNFKWSYLKHDKYFLAGAIITSMILAPLMKAYSLKYMFAGKSAFLGSLSPFYTAIFAYFLLGEYLTKKKLFGIIVAIFGAIVLCFSSSESEEALKAFLFFSFPELAAIFGVAFKRFGWILKQVLLKNDRYSVNEINSITMIASGIVSLVISGFYENISTDIYNISLNTWGLFAYTMLIGNVLSYTLLGMLFKKYSANFVSIISFLLPIFTALMGMLLLGEVISTNLLISAVVIFIGVYIFYQDEVKTV